MSLKYIQQAFLAVALLSIVWSTPSFAEEISVDNRVWAQLSPEEKKAIEELLHASKIISSSDRVVGVDVPAGAEAFRIRIPNPISVVCKAACASSGAAAAAACSGSTVAVVACVAAVAAGTDACLRKCR